MPRYFLTTTTNPETCFTADTLEDLTNQLIEHAHQTTSTTPPNTKDIITLAAHTLNNSPRAIVLLTPNSPTEAWQLVENRRARETHELEIQRLATEREPLLTTLVNQGLPLRHAGALAGLSQTHVKRIITQ